MESRQCDISRFRAVRSAAARCIAPTRSSSIPSIFSLYILPPCRVSGLDTSTHAHTHLHRRFCANSLHRSCCCQPTAHCNKSRDPLYLSRRPLAPPSQKFHAALRHSGKLTASMSIAVTRCCKPVRRFSPLVIFTLGLTEINSRATATSRTVGSKMPRPRSVSVSSAPTGRRPVPPIVKLTRCQSAGYERAIYRSHGERNTAPDSAAAARGFYRSLFMRTAAIRISSKLGKAAGVSALCSLRNCHRQYDNNTPFTRYNRL